GSGVHGAAAVGRVRCDHSRVAASVEPVASYQRRSGGEDAVMSRAGTIAVAAAWLAVVCVVVGLSLAIGTESIDLGTAYREFAEGVPLSEAPTLSIVLELRLPRTLLAMIAGSALALAGCAFQALLRNPLATPYTLGIASFGALGAYAAM